MSATCARSTLLGSRSSTPSWGLDSVTWTPWSSSRPVTTVTSRICGTFSRRLGSSPRSAATIALETKFLAPRTVIVPVRGVPPWTVRTSVTATILTYTRRPTRQARFGRRRGADSGRVAAHTAHAVQDAEVPGAPSGAPSDGAPSDVVVDDVVDGVAGGGADDVVAGVVDGVEGVVAGAVGALSVVAPGVAASVVAASVVAASV